MWRAVGIAFGVVVAASAALAAEPERTFANPRTGVSYVLHFPSDIEFLSFDGAVWLFGAGDAAAGKATVGLSVEEPPNVGDTIKVGAESLRQACAEYRVEAVIEKSEHVAHVHCGRFFDFLIADKPALIAVTIGGSGEALKQRALEAIKADLVAGNYVKASR